MNAKPTPGFGRVVYASTSSHHFPGVTPSPPTPTFPIDYHQPSFDPLPIDATTMTNSFPPISDESVVAATAAGAGENSRATTAPSSVTSIEDLNALGTNHTMHSELELKAELLEQRVKHVKEGLNSNLLTFTKLNETCVHIASLTATHARAVSNYNTWTLQLASTTSRINEILTKANAIADPELRTQMQILEENRGLLEKGIKGVPEQLKGIERTLPLLRAEKAKLEGELGMALRGLGHYRGLADNVEGWYLEEEGSVVMYAGVRGNEGQSLMVNSESGGLFVA